VPKKDKTKIRERNGLYTYRYSIEDPETGKRKQKETKGFKTLAEAKAEGVRIEAALLDRSYIEPTKMTMSQLLDIWFEGYKAGPVRSNTILTRISAIDRAKKLFGGRKVAMFTVDMYQRALDEVCQDGASASTINNLQSVVSMALRKAVIMGVAKQNVAGLVNIPKPKDPTADDFGIVEEIPKYLEKDQLKLFLSTGKNKNAQLGRFVFILAYTGMRIGELLALKISDVDMINKRISITKTLHTKGKIEDYVLGPPKNKSSRRRIDVSVRVIGVFQEQLSWRKEYKFKNLPWFYEDDFIFFNVIQTPGYPLRESAVLEWMGEVLQEAHLPDNLTPHSLRHTYTSLMAEAGVDLLEIQRLLGHKNDGATRRVYLHVTESRKRAAVEKLDALMDSID